jgi:hypothetical protein
MKKYLSLLAIIFVIYNYNNFAFADEAKEKVLTRADVIEKISAADFFKKKIGDLLNWSVGYDITKINRTNLAPIISYIKVDPSDVPPDDRTIVSITAKVSDPSGLDNIKGVRADLSSINRLPNQMLVDNGLWGDIKSSDGVFTLQTTVGNGVPSGTKDIPVAVANKAGWVAISRTNIDVRLNPIVSDGMATPQSIHPDGKEEVLLTVKVENPGRQEDIKDVSVDLTDLGLENSVRMWDDGTHGDIRAGDRIFSVSVVPKENIGPWTRKLTVRATNVFGGSVEGEITLVVQ